MKNKLIIVSALLLTGIPLLLFGQRSNEETATKKVVSYMVIKGDDLSHVAARFHLHTGALRHLNKISPKTHLAYPGMVLQIPVAVRPRIWNPAKAPGMVTRERTPSVDYEVNTDVYDGEIREDFAELSEVHDDQAQYEALSAHLSSIDRRISYLAQVIDSMKRNDPSSRSNNPDMSEIDAMRAARMQHGLRSKWTQEIDSLNKTKSTIADVFIKLRNKITEYEYLADNAEYSKENYQREDAARDTRWMEQIAPSSHGNFIQPPATPAAAIQPITDTTASTETISKVDTITIDGESMVVDPDTAVATAIEENQVPDIIPVNETPANKTAESAPIVAPMPIILPDKTDMAPIVTKVTSVMKVDIAELHTSIMKPLLLRQDKPEPVLYLLASTAMAKPTIDTATLPARTDISARPRSKEYALLASSDKSSGLETRFDPTSLRREKKVNPDPLATYKTDSNFVMTNITLKEVPIVSRKHKPKYLIPVDSVSRIKAEFYLLRARQALEKGEFTEGDKYLRKSLDLNPNNAATWMLHGDLYLTMGEAQKALKEYTISCQIDSSNPKVFYNMALLYAKANDEQKAYMYFSKATDINDKYLLAYMGRATVQMDHRDYENAITDFDKVISINKYYTPAYKGRGLARMQMKNFNMAVKDFDLYLDIEDPDGYVLYQRGIAKILSNNLLQGCLDLSSALELGYKDAEKAIKKFCE